MGTQRRCRFGIVLGKATEKLLASTRSFGHRAFASQDLAGSVPRRSTCKELASVSSNLSKKSFDEIENHGRLDGITDKEGDFHPRLRTSHRHEENHHNRLVDIQLPQLSRLPVPSALRSERRHCHPLLISEIFLEPPHQGG